MMSRSRFPTRPNGRFGGPEFLEPRYALSASPFVISEFMAINASSSLSDSSDTPDWIEILNQSESPMSLRGWYLTDTPSDLNRWPFPDVLVSPGGYLLVIANSCDTTNDSCSVDGQLQANFSLGAQEYLALVDPTGLVVSAYGSANGNYPEQRADVSYGLSTRVGSTRMETLFMPNPTWIQVSRERRPRS